MNNIGQRSLTIVRAYVAAANAHNLARLAHFFAPGARLELHDLDTIVGRQAIHDLHDYDRALNTRLTLLDARVDDYQVRSRLNESNDWLAAAGIVTLAYQRVTYHLHADGTILRISARLAPDSAEQLQEATAIFHTWASQHRPDAYARLFTAAGRFRYSYDSGLQVVALLRDCFASLPG